MSWDVFIEAPREFRARKGTGKMTSAPDWLNANHRLHFRAKNEKTQAWLEMALTVARQHRLPRAIPPRVFIEAWIHPENARSYDAMNLYPTAKAIVDGLVKYGLVKDDSNKYVVGPFCLPGAKRATGGVTIRVFTLAPGELYPTNYTPYEGRAEELT